MCPKEHENHEHNHHHHRHHDVDDDNHHKDRLEKKVVIIGAGASGLQCAFSLIQEKGVEKNDIIILEARPRVGGRVYSTLETRQRVDKNESLQQFYMDHGAAWVHGTGAAEWGSNGWFHLKEDDDDDGDSCHVVNPVMELLSIQNRKKGNNKIGL